MLPYTPGCSNHFVGVEYSATLSAIICRFLNQTDTSVKSCTVMYGPCDQQSVKTTQGKTTLEAPNYIELHVDFTGGSLDCYVVTASSGTSSVVVEARRMQTGKNDSVSGLIPKAICLLNLAHRKRWKQ